MEVCLKPDVRSDLRLSSSSSTFSRRDRRFSRWLRMRLRGSIFPVFTSIALLSVCSTVWAGVKDTVLYCPTGSPCSVLDQSFTGPAQFNSLNGADFVSLYADATAGVLHTLAAYSVSAPIAGTGQVNGNAEWIDSVTISSPTIPNGTHAYLFPTISVTGSTSGSADAILTFILFGAPPAVQSAKFTGNGIHTFQAVPIILGPGGTVNFEYGLSSEAFWGPSTLSATSDFLHTATLTGLTVALDQAGTISVADVTFVSASGVLYTTAGTVPEPAAVLLIGSGLLLIAARKLGRF